MTLAVASTAALAAGLGPVAEHSSLGQPLRVAIPLLLGPGEEIAAECFRMVAAERDPDGVPQVLYGRVVLERTAAGPRLLVTGQQPVNDPILRLTVQAGCDAASIRREYTLLMDPPVIDTPMVAAEAASAVAVPPAAAAPGDRRREPGVAGGGSTAPRAAAPAAARKAGPARKAGAPAKAPGPRRPPPVNKTEEPRLKVSRSAPVAVPGTLPGATADAAGGQGPTQDEVRAQEEIANALEAETVVLRQRVAELTALVDRMQDQVHAQEAQRKAAEEEARAEAEAKASPMAVALAWWEANWQLVLAIVVLPALIAAWLLRRRKAATAAEPLPVPRAAPSRTGPAQGRAAPPPAPTPAGKSAAPAPKPATAGSGELAVSELSQITEEARVYVALGHADRAMNVLREYVRSTPQAMPAAWMMLLDLYHSNGRRQDFRQFAQEFHQRCNVQAPTWESFAEREATGLHEYPHVTKRIIGLWRLPECRDYLERLLRDNREGKRGGFSLAAYSDILTLLQILDAPAVDIDSDLAEEGMLRPTQPAAASGLKHAEAPTATGTSPRPAGTPARPTQASIAFDTDEVSPSPPGPRAPPRS